MVFFIVFLSGNLTNCDIDMLIDFNLKYAVEWVHLIQTQLLQIIDIPKQMQKSKYFLKYLIK